MAYSVSTFRSSNRTADFVNNYYFDAANRMYAINQDGVTGGNAVDPKSVGFTYFADGQFDTITRTQLALDAHDPEGTDVADSVYGYDGLGRITSLVHSQAPGHGCGRGIRQQVGIRMTQFRCG